MSDGENSRKRRKGDEDGDDETTHSAANGKKQVKVEEKTNEDVMQEAMTKYNKISERDLSCNSIMWPS